MYEVNDGTASRAAGVRLKKLCGSGLRCVITGRTDGHSLFSVWPSEASRNLGFLRGINLYHNGGSTLGVC